MLVVLRSGALVFGCGVGRFRSGCALVWGLRSSENAQGLFNIPHPSNGGQLHPSEMSIFDDANNFERSIYTGDSNDSIAIVHPQFKKLPFFNS